MTNHLFITRLANNLDAFNAMLSPVKDPEMQRWKPAPDKWCLLELVCHLRDEEVEDFRLRVATTLESPGQKPPNIDPVGWVKDRDYMGQNYTMVLADFLNEREKSIAFLKTLSDPDWSGGYQHDSLGFLSAQMFLENWLAHDYLHLRQILKMKYVYLESVATTGLGYAGNW